jgi:predicted DNA-binding transcriptional regulator AlpA
MVLRSDPIAYPPRGLSREEAARYVGVGTTKFDEMIRDRLMPKPRQAGGRTIWDRAELDMAFSELPHQSSENKLDRIFGRSS